MLERYKRTIGDLFRVCDSSIVVSAWLLAYWERFYASPFEVTRGLPEFQTYATLAPLVAILWIVAFTWMRVYESRRMVGRIAELLLVLKAHGLALLLFIAITYLFEDYKYSRLVMVYFAVSGAAGLALFRLVMRSFLRHLRARGLNLRRVLAIGDGANLEALLRRLNGFPELGLHVVGVVTSDDCERSAIYGKHVVGHFSDIRSVLQHVRADEILIALEPHQHRDGEAILEQLADEVVDIRIVPDVSRYVALGCDVEDFDGLPVMRLNDSPMIGVAAFAKRMTDLALSCLALTVLAPLMLLIAAVVKFTSRGPVLYRQERMGLDGRTFDMLKFRSMCADAERVSGAVWATADDSRKTAVGQLLRKTSLDELPQFWNVLVGDMSLVGPRPERPVFVQQFRGQIPHYMLRHKVKSGITGWAQVNGLRGNTSLVHRIEYDLFYIKNWSYLLDLRILLLTVWKGFVSKNAY